MHVHVHLHIYVYGSVRGGPTRCIHIHIYAYMHVYTPAAQHNTRLSPSHKPGQKLLLLTITTHQPSPKPSWVEPDMRPIPIP